MATTTYIYPHVNISTSAKIHSNSQPETEDTTRLFVPILTEKGPDGVITRVRTLGEFSDIFGSLDYERNGQMALNLYNWLSAGGTAYIYNLNGTEKDASKPVKAISKYKIKDTDFEANKIIEVKASPEKSPDKYTTKELSDIKAEDDSILLYFDSDKKEKYYKISVDGANKSATLIEATSYSFKYFDGENEVTEFDYGVKYTKKLIATKTTTTGEGDSATTTETHTVGTHTFKATDDDMVKAKYYGVYYNNMSIVLFVRSAAVFDLKIYHLDSTTQIKTLVEEYPRLRLDSYKKVLAASEYIDSATFDITRCDCYDSAKKELIANKQVKLEFSDGSVVFSKDIDEYKAAEGNKEAVTLLEEFWTNEEKAKKVLENDLAYPIDMILDAGYPKAVKQAMLGFISNNENRTSPRTDIVGLFDIYELGDSTDGISKAPTAKISAPENDFASYMGTNIAFYEQYFKINDTTFTDSDIYVTPTYFLSRLIPENDLQYGIQFATAGIRRAVLSDAIYINENPLPSTKNSWFKSRINYAEKTPRECAFMSQRTFDGSTEDHYTALSFLNNSRCLEKMKKDIERLGRDYLFEFNDSTTLAQMSNVLNKYITDWISNRTLSKGIVTVSKNKYSDETVDVNLTIKFNGTIEIISVDIVIE